MKKNLMIRFFCLVIVSYLVLSPFLEARGYQEHKPIKAEVTVTNVEVPVRVIYKGEPVNNLTQEDFTIYENNKKVEINGFFVKRRKIGISPLKEPVKTSGVKNPFAPLRPRMFVLAFNVTSYNTYFQEAMDHLFDKILKPTDYVIVFANSTVRQYPELENKSKIKTQIINDLKEESKKARRRLLTYINKIETYINGVHPDEDFRKFLTAGNAEVRKPAQYLIRFLKRYLLAWNEYKRRYLTPQVDQFYYFARYLENIKAEKYVLNFYQFEFFPRIRLNSRAMHKIREISNVMSNTNDGSLISQGHLINRMLNQLLNDYDLEKAFPNKEISKLFYKVDATFHSFFIRATNPATRDDFEYRTLSSDLENVLKNITDITGGKNITSNKLVKSLETVSEVEDVYYILTYVPQTPNRAAKLKIKVKNKKYKVLYDDNFRADYISEYLQKLEEKIQTPDIQIKGFSFDRDILEFTVTNYLMKAIDKKAIGHLKVRIQVKDVNNHELFDQEKTLTAQRGEMKISIGAFKKIEKGYYDFLIDVQDVFTGKEANFHQKIKVNQ